MERLSCRKTFVFNTKFCTFPIPAMTKIKANKGFSTNHANILNLNSEMAKHSATPIRY